MVKRKQKSRTVKRAAKSKIVKRRGHEERFDERKVYASSFSACMSSHLGEMKSEEIADRVTNDVKKWSKSKNELTSDQIFKQIVKSLKKHDRDAAFMYETHMDVS